MRPAFLVDGVTEQKFVQIVCPGRPVKLVNCNGASVSVAAIARRVASLIRLWGGKYHPIVILVDREDRDVSFDVFADDLEEKIRLEGVGDQLIVGVADRMIENWMLADPAVWPGKIISGEVDGTKGSSVIRSYLKSYDKAANGPGILAKSRPSEIALRSPSFRHFSERLARLNCPWLRR